MTQHAAMKDRILRVITAILQPAGFTTQWFPSSRRGFETRETFRFDSSDRMKAITGDDSTFVLHIETRRATSGTAFSSLPDACDWTLDQLVDWNQELEEADIADLPEADLSLEPVRLMSRILDTADDYPNTAPVDIGASKWHAGYASDPEANRPIILVMTQGRVEEKWGAETFLSRKR